MKITHIVENLNRGGLERVVIDLIRAQRDAGHSCRVICLFERGALADELTGCGIVVDACNKRVGLDWRSLARMRRLLVQNPVDILHTHNAVAHYHAVLAAWRLPYRHRVINTLHGMMGARPSRRRDWLYRQSLRATHAVVAVSEAVRSNIEGAKLVPIRQLRAVPNGIRVDQFEPASQETRTWLRSQLDLPPGAQLVGFVGRLSWAKDLATLIRSFAIVQRQFPEATLVLVGDGACRSELENVAAEVGVSAHVKFLGDRSDVTKLLPGFDIFAMSSVTEGYSIALLEACAAGLPIVATSVGGNAEIVREGSNGLLVPARDSAALAQGLSTLLADPARARAMGLAAREWILREGSFRSMERRYAEIYGVGA